ncbi:transposase [Xanthomonas oryzae]|uniref:transposase n=1 Tax=Xanthomonas oryzae TaxID=347 RepID=UPI0031B861F2
MAVRLHSTCEKPGRVLDTMAMKRKKRQARCTWRSIRWDICSPSQVNASNEQERAQVRSLAPRGTTRDSSENGQRSLCDLLPRRWVVERSFGWVNRFRRLARDYDALKC